MIVKNVISITDALYLLVDQIELSDYTLMFLSMTSTSGPMKVDLVDHLCSLVFIGGHSFGMLSNTWEL